MINRRTAITAGFAAIASTTATANSTNADSGLTELCWEWQTNLDAWNNTSALSDDKSDQFCDRQYELLTQMADTRATSLEGVRAKFRTILEHLDGSVLDLDDQMVQSIARDLGIGA